MPLAQALKESEVFFKEWLRSPKAMGSIIPSSAVLAKAIALEVARRDDEYVVELGGGTGSISQGLLDAGIPRDKLVIIEYADDLYNYLKSNFPGCRVIQADATKLADVLKSEKINKVGTVISGLPMVGMPDDFRQAIVNSGFASMPKGGFMLQYSYSPLCPVPAKELNIRAKLVRYVVRNVPPAAVWKYERH